MAYFLLAFPAFFIEIATACFFGLPAFISFLMFIPMTFLLVPSFSDIVVSSKREMVRSKTGSINPKLERATHAWLAFKTNAKKHR